MQGLDSWYTAELAMLYQPNRGEGRVGAWRVQGLAYEARLLLWTMVDLNCRLLGRFLVSNMEDLSSPHKPDPGLWSSILVRAQALNSKAAQAQQGLWLFILVRLQTLKP